MIQYRAVCATPTCVSEQPWDRSSATTGGQGQGGGRKTITVNIELADPNDDISVLPECQSVPGDFSPWTAIGTAMTESGRVSTLDWCERIRLNVQSQTCAGACPAVSGWVRQDMTQ
jgi:hypothetical protein